ncbi:Uncharacterised protein [Capnocytophaga ochracea]|uniref:Uncharacterized protein n=1 Tax=Capnocytophaga ochracea TaxID=1018 RepID=A0A2X2RBC1_CAPOC|nr:META domain-containing protein [Capnocytophaga ochracea]SQA78398.1 Uncharacterised protein [Capnocytophaga ochracea]
MEIKTFLALLLLVIVGCSCSKTDKEIDPMLYGTWRLVGVSDMEGHLKELKPNEKECDLCYSITFKQDNTLKGYTSFNEVMGIYRADNNKLIFTFGHTKKSEKIDSDGDLYLALMYNLSANKADYRVENKQLYLYYKKNKKSIKTDSLPNEGYVLFNKKM